MKRFIVPLFFIAVIVAGYIAQQQKGILEGRVTISPLCPVEPCHISSEQLAQIYAAEKIIIYSENKTSVVKEFSPNSGGNYSIELNPGNYVIDIERKGIGGSGNLPADIKIESGKMVTLNIDIDTGIR